MRLTFSLLCDYAGVGNNGKLLAVGIFDTIFNRNTARPIIFPECWIIAKIEADFLDGTPDGSIVMRMIGPDGEQVGAHFDIPTQWHSQGPGRSIQAGVFVKLQGFGVYDEGDYHVSYTVNGKEIGQMPIFVVPAPEPAGGPL